jgi:hypothetical protein
LFHSPHSVSHDFEFGMVTIEELMFFSYDRLSLVAALRDARLNAHPVLLSTRNNGLPSPLYPVPTDFNYVIARVKIGDNYYLLDATEDVYPFGLLPERCLNGMGRALGPDSSQWAPRNATQRKKHVTCLRPHLTSKERLRGES